jgi:hypothetical protein
MLSTFQHPSRYGITICTVFSILLLLIALEFGTDPAPIRYREASSTIQRQRTLRNTIGVGEELPTA